MHYVYVIWNKKNDEFYLGSSVDPWNRLDGHNLGDTASTQGRLWELVYVEGYISRNAICMKKIFRFILLSKHPVRQL